MIYSDFKVLREALLAEKPDLLDCGETNLYRSLADIVPALPPIPDERFHRCHLAAQWVDWFGLEPEASKRAFVSSGVRHSLELIFAHCAQTGAKIWLPEDNYPVFAELARSAGLSPTTFPTLPVPIWPNTEPAGSAEFLLVTNPIKPLGRCLDDSDVATLKLWLAQSEKRRVILDSVYVFGDRLPSSTLELCSTSQVIVLHSLTKGWLHPRLFGIALFPKQDFEEWSQVFRASPPPQPSLAGARYLLAEQGQSPQVVSQRLENARRSMLPKLPSRIETAPGDIPSYFLVAEAGWEELLEKGVIGIPASVFGSECDRLTILSSLKFA